MNRENTYPWVGAIIGGIIGLLVAIALSGHFEGDLTAKLNEIVFVSFCTICCGVIGSFFGSYGDYSTYPKDRDIKTNISYGIIISIVDYICLAAAITLDSIGITIAVACLCIFINYVILGIYDVRIIGLPGGNYNTTTTNRVIEVGVLAWLIGTPLVLFGFFFFRYIIGDFYEVIPLFLIPISTLIGYSISKPIIINAFVTRGYFIGNSIIIIANKTVRRYHKWSKHKRHGKEALNMYEIKLREWDGKGYNVSALKELLKK